MKEFIEKMSPMLDKVKFFFQSPSYSRTLALVGILVLVLALPVTVAFLGQQTQTKQSAHFSDCPIIEQACGKDADVSSYCTNPGSFASTDRVSIDTDVNCGKRACTLVTHNSTLCGYKPPPPKCPAGVPGGSFCSATGTCRAEGGYQIGASCGGGLICCEPIPAPKPTATPTPDVNRCGYSAQAFHNPTKSGSGNNDNVSNYGKVATCAKYECPAGQLAIGGSCSFTDSACCFALPKYTVNYTCMAGGNVFSGTDGSVTYCDSGKACVSGSAWPTNSGPSDAKSHLCLFSTSSCEVKGGSCEKYQCGNGQVTISGSCTAPDSVCCVKGTPKYTCLSGNYAFSGTDGSVTFCGTRTGCNAGASTTANDPTAAKNTLCTPAFAHVVIPSYDNRCGANKAGFCVWASNIGPFTLDPMEAMINGGQLPSCSQIDPLYSDIGYVKQDCTQIPLQTNSCCAPNTKVTCSDVNPDYTCATSQAPSYCPQGYELIKASFPQVACGPTGGSHSCCKALASTITPTVPPNGCTSNCSGPGSNPTATPIPCTNGKQTQFVLNIKLPGIGSGTLENNTPAHPVKHGSLIVKDGNGTQLFGVTHDFTHAFTHGNTNGPLTSEKVNLGSTQAVCGKTYHVEVKLPGYVTIKKDIAYGQDQTLTVAETDVIPGDIVGNTTNNFLTPDGKVIGDDVVDILDYNVVKQCRNADPSVGQTFQNNTTTVTVKCGDLMNFFDYTDGGTLESAVATGSGIGEWDANYNMWVRGFVKANGY